MRRADIEALGELAGEALAGSSTLVREIHQGIARRPFEILGPAGAPARVVHDGVSRAVYTSVREGLRVAARRGARVAALRAPEDGAALGSAVPSSIALGALNGVYGSRLQEPVRLTMEVRRRGSRVPLTPAGLAAAFPDATSRIVVFVHGQCETDEAWWRMTRRPDGTRRRNYGERLQDELSFTPVYLRYNTGLRISENGEALADRLAALVSVWPVRVEDLALVGHSMGGLVVRSACGHAADRGMAWLDLVAHVVCLGRPYLGARLEQGAQALGRALARLPETRPVARLLEVRGPELVDLRSGSVPVPDGCGEELDYLLGDRCTQVAGARLLNHPAVYQQLRTWLTRRRRVAPMPLAASL